MRAGVELAEASVARTTSTPSWVRAPAGRAWPASHLAGMDSPVMCSELTRDAPYTTMPSSATWQDVAHAIHYVCGERAWLNVPHCAPLNVR